MSRTSIRHIVVLILIVSLLMSLGACDNTVITKNPDVSPDATPSLSVSEVSTADTLFTVRYEADYSFNPITGTSSDNMALVPLMYEGLFVLNKNLVAEPVLCESCETLNGITYTVKLKTGVAMSDGSNLNATDVKYTLTRAMESGRYAGRLKIIDSITAPDSETVKITLKAANYKLPELLDIPIIKNGTADQNYPPGSGPYYYENSGVPRLVAFSNYRAADSIPIPLIYLKDCTDTELSVAFSSQAVDLFQDDPADATKINILSDHETRYFTTTILQFVGFNVKNSLLSNHDLRRALGLIIDRKDIVSTVYSSHATAAPLALSPFCSSYDTAWETSVADPLSQLSQIFASLDMKDNDFNGYLEIWSTSGWTPIALKFIVNADNPYKVDAAQKITDSLKTVGIDVNLTKLSWDDYMTALTSGDFDMYYGDVCLPADYDLTELLSPGGSLDYGHAANSEYKARIDSFLAASGDDAQKQAAKKLCLYIREFAPIIPVLYRQLNVHTNKNVVSGIKPTQSSIFYGLTGWEITLG